MIVAPITITLAGTPKPGGSFKCLGRSGAMAHRVIPDAGPPLKKWRTDVRRAAGRAEQRADQWQALAVTMTITVARPMDHYRTGRFASLLRTGAPVFPTTKGTRTGGDVDKLARAVLDSLTDSGVLDDDAQVVELHAAKCYPHCSFTPDALGYPGAVIRIAPVDVDAAAVVTADPQAVLL